jgi:hypothetical protein
MCDMCDMCVTYIHTYIHTHTHPDLLQSTMANAVHYRKTLRVGNGVSALVTLNVVLNPNSGARRGRGGSGSSSSSTREIDHDRSSGAGSGGRGGSSSSSSSNSTREIDHDRSSGAGSGGRGGSSSSSSSSRESEVDGSQSENKRGDSGGCSSSRMRNRDSEGSDNDRPAQRVKPEPVWPQEPSYSPGRSEEEGSDGEEEEEEEEGTPVCFNCNADILDDEGYTDDGFWVWTWRLGEMAWVQETKRFCHADCHRTALQWTLQGLIPVATTRELKANVDALVRPLSREK